MAVDTFINLDKFFGQSESQIRINKSNYLSGIWLNVNGECVHLTKEQTEILIQTIQAHMKV